MPPPSSARVKVSDQPVTSEVRSMTQRSWFVCWLITPSKVAAVPVFKHHGNPLIKLRQMIYVLFVC